MFTVQEFKKFYNLVDGFVSKETETFKFRFLMQSLYDHRFKEEFEHLIETVHASNSPKLIDEQFEYMRRLCVEKTNMAENEVNEEKKMDYSLSALAYFCLLESFNENSIFSQEIEKMIVKNFGEYYLDILRGLDRENVSDDVKQRNIKYNGESKKNKRLASSDTAKKYLIMKKWQDKQRSFSLKHIRPFYLIEKKYIGEDISNLMELHKRTLIKRALEKLSQMELIPLDLLSCYCIAGVGEELVSIVGGKARGLAVLNAAGYNVPTTYIIPAGSEVNEEVLSELSKEVRYAVRSSATCEDGKKFSFAGIFESYLDVKIDSIKDKVNAVQNSTRNERVEKYLQAHNLKSTPKMAVIIQHYIEPEKAGVWLGNKYNSGVLEWCNGSGEKLVSGKITPQIEEWESGRRIVGAGDVVSYKLVKDILNLQKVIGEIADIEWCLKNGDIYMLQYRPVTAKIQVENIMDSKMNNSIIQGVPASGGYVDGNAKFIGKNFRDVDWNSREILLAWFTDPDWLDILQKASGLVTAVGGMLCHAAIIARELEIPCVTGIGGENMKQIWGGGRIKIDGYKGIVEMIKEN